VKAVIKNRKILIPKEIAKELDWLTNGECEIEASANELIITRPVAVPQTLLKLLKEPPIEASIEEIMKTEVVEDA